MARTLGERLAAGHVLVLDGAMGTELERRRVATPLPAWTASALITAPAEISAIHREYVAAGADLLTTATFRTTRRALAPAGVAERAAELTALAVELAREAARGAPGGRAVHVLGSIAPLADCYRPDLVPAPDALAREHAEHATSLARAGVDALLVETMNTRREAIAAIGAGRATGLSVLASFIADQDGNLFDGEPLTSAVPALIAAGPAALLVNCTPVATTGRLLAALRALAGSTPVGAYANIGYPHPGGWTWSADTPPVEFGRLAAGWVRTGAQIVGGCCGTTPAHIAAVRAAVDAIISSRPAAPNKERSA
jgi:S-methylmethionine-dependent homocysteine/selenocysteine methylase